MGCNINERNVEGQISQKIRRHTTNTYSCEEENLTTNTGVGIMLNRKSRQKKYRYRTHQRTGHHCHDRGKPPTHQTDECVFLHHSGYAVHHIEKMYRTIENQTENCKRYIPTIGGDFNAELGLGHGTECISVGRHTLNGGNKRGDWI